MKGRREHHPLRPVAIIGMLVLLVFVGGSMLAKTTTNGSPVDSCPVASSPTVHTFAAASGHASYQFQTTSLLTDCVVRVRHHLAGGSVLIGLVFVGALGAFMILRSPRDPQ